MCFSGWLRKYCAEQAALMRDLAGTGMPPLTIPWRTKSNKFNVFEGL